MQSVSTAAELKVLTDKGTVVVDFGATWCPPCKLLVPIFSEVSQLETFKEISFVKVDIDDASDLANDYDVTSVPTLVVIKNGKTVATQSGLMAKAALTAWISKNTQ